MARCPYAGHEEETAVKYLYRSGGQTEPAGDYHHLLAVTQYTPGKPVTYYAGFGWKNGLPTIESFREYVGNLSEALANPLKVTID